MDAVVIATPDHWHALMFVDACHAGKDVYVEKPLSLTVWEGRRMVEVAEQTKRVTQVGIHRRSAKFLMEAVELRPHGRARAHHRGQELPHPERVARTGSARRPTARRPTDFDWDQWLGPAPKVPYNRNRTFYNFRWFYNYSGGQLTNFGVHYMDMLRWCLGKEAPKAVVAMGGRYAGIKDNREIPDTLEVLWDFGGMMMIFCRYNANAASGLRDQRRDGDPRHQGHDVPVRQPLGSGSGDDHRTDVRRAHAAGPGDGTLLRRVARSR